jgi:hypothetical protein
LAVANVAEGDDEDEEKSPDEPSSGSITDDALVAVELKLVTDSVPVVAEEEVDEVGREEIDEPL